MQINIDKSLVEFTPENSEETAKLQQLWRLMVDCARFNKKMVPIGEYIPKQSTFARFAIEGMETKGPQAIQRSMLRKTAVVIARPAINTLS